MSLRKGVGKPSVSGNANSPSTGKGVPESSNPRVDQLSQGVADINLDSAQDGDWEVYAKKSKNKAGSSAAKSWGSQNSNGKAWERPNLVQKQGIQSNVGPRMAPGNNRTTVTADPKRPAGRGNAKPQPANKSFENNNVVPSPAIPPPLQHGWNWASRVGSAQSKGSEDGPSRDDDPNDIEDDKDDDDESDDMDGDDDELLSDDFDSDTSQKSHETRKNDRWFKSFFTILDNLSVEEMNEPGRQWHCPACQGGPGAIDWFRGLQPLITHAKTKGSKRVKIHREFAMLLDEELQRRGTSAIPAGESFGKWKGLNDPKDHEIVWPPMVIIMNTRLEQNEDEKWIGMGNQELLECFGSYAAVKARHSYGPQGHRGMSVLIFENSATGYLEAERLDKHFQEQKTDRDAWDHRPVIFLPGGGGKRQLYGYMAKKEDLDIFNQHSHGKMRLKFEMRSYQEMVVSQIKQMSEDNQQLLYFQNKAAKEKRHSKALEESFGIMSEKLRKTMEENRIVRQRTRRQHEQNKEEMVFQEEFFKDQMKIIHEATDAKEAKFEKLQQEERLKKSNTISTTTEDQRRRLEEIEKFIKCQDKEMEDFVAERDKLIKAHEDKKVEMKKKHWEEEVELEKVFATRLTGLMDKYTPNHPEEEEK